MSSPSEYDAYLVKKLHEILLKIYPTFSQHASSRVTKRVGESLDNTRIIDPYKDEIKLDVSVGDLFEENPVKRDDNNFISGSNLEKFVISPKELQTPDPELLRNLREFIDALKMSLYTYTSTNYKGEHDGFDNTYGNGIDVNGKDTMSSVGDLEINLTREDITDLNNLLHDDDDYLNRIRLKTVLIITTYFLIACISIIGNLLVVQLVIRRRRLHTLTHALLANLAVADLLMAILNIPFSAARVILSDWPFGQVLCSIVPFVQVSTVYVSSITMAVIALDRYQVIMNPLGRRMKSSQGILIVAGIWFLSGLLSLPYALQHKVVTLLTLRVVERCVADWKSLEIRRLLTLLTFLAQYLIPLLFTSISYFFIMQRLRQRSSNLGPTTPRQVAAQSKSKRTTIKMLFLVVIFFALSWLPINIYHLLTHFSVVRHNSTAILICHIIAMSSSGYNPFIYFWLNMDFRREALKWLRCFRPERRSTNLHPGIEVNGLLSRTDGQQQSLRANNQNNSGLNNNNTLMHTLSLRSDSTSPSNLNNIYNQDQLAQNMPSTSAPTTKICSRQRRKLVRDQRQAEMLFLTESSGSTTGVCGEDLLGESSFTNVANFDGKNTVDNLEPQKLESASDSFCNSMNNLEFLHISQNSEQNQHHLEDSV